MTEFLVDLSDYDWARGDVDVAAMRADGIISITHKATEGTSVVHRHLADALNRARAAGMPALGAYHVVRSGDINAQVSHFLGYLDQHVPWWRTHPAFFLQPDGERWSYDPVSAAQIKAFTHALKAAEPDAVINYSSKGQYGDTLTGIEAPLWNANYPTYSSSLGKCPPGPYRDVYARSGGDTGPGWARYSDQTPAIWQFTDNGTVGSQHGCDVNAFRGSVDDFLTLIHASAAHLTGATTVATIDDALAELTDIESASVNRRNALIWWLRGLADQDDALIADTSKSFGRPPFPGLKQLAKQISDVALDAHAAANRPITVTMTAEDLAAIVAGLKAEVASLIPTPEQIAAAVLDEQHRRDAA